MPGRPSIEPWPEGLAEDLASPDAFGPGAAGTEPSVEIIQTHLSRVHLVGDRVYKLPRAVDVGFVSFARRSERALECRREVELNRRLAPDVYLGVAPVVERDGRFRIGEPIEHPGALADDHEYVIVMRRLPEERDAQSLLERGALRIEHMQCLAARLATFHGRHSLGRPAPFEVDVWQARNADPIRANFDTLDRASDSILDSARVESLRGATEAALASHREAFERRRRDGRAVDAHGDLHLQHVWFESDDADPLAIDALVFREDLRRIDAASEMAFLAMDLRYRGRADLAEHLLARYAADRNDYDLYSVVDLFACYRAAVRAKVAALAAMDADLDASQRARSAESARQHLAASAAHLDRPGAGPLVLVGGTVGSGKSTVARAIAGPDGIPVVASDVIRAAVEEAGPSGEDRYSQTARDRVYEAMFERASLVLASGRPVLLDATFARRAHREAARDLAARFDTDCWWVEARCSRETALDRLARRQARGDDASEAGPAQLAGSESEFERDGDWPAERAAVITTDQDDVDSRCRTLAAQLGAARP